MMRRRNYLLSPMCPANNDDGGDDDGGGGGDDTGGDDKGGGGREYTAPQTQADFDELVKDRVKRAEKKGYDTAVGKYKEKADKHDALEAELGTDKDKAVAAAKDETRKEIAGQYAPRLVKQAFRAEAKGVLTGDQLDALLEDLDLSKYLDDEGDVDEEKVATKIKKIAPGKGDGDDKDDRGKGGGRGLGQGNRQPADAKPGDAGRAEAQKRYGKKSD